MTRLGSRERRSQVLKAAMRVCEKNGLHYMTRDAVAREAGVSAGLVNLYFGSMETLKYHVMREAITRPSLGILAQGLALRCPVAVSAPQELKNKAVKTLS